MRGQAAPTPGAVGNKAALGVSSHLCIFKGPSQNSSQLPKSLPEIYLLK